MRRVGRIRLQAPFTAAFFWSWVRQRVAAILRFIAPAPPVPCVWREFGRARAEEMAGLIEGRFEWTWVNEGVNALVTGGLYREALVYSERWSEDTRRQGTVADANAWALVEINLAEAEYNLGLVDAAFERIERLVNAIESNTGPFRDTEVEPIVVNGTHCQRAWIAALRGEHALGLEYVAAIDEQGLPEPYRAEVDYTRALLLLKAGRCREAEDAAEAGWSRATRPSSQRNGLFLIGIILAERGDHVMAERAFERGAGHHYDGQGGDALLRWAQLLRGLGRSFEAQRAFQWCIERDPQSPAALAAEQHLTPESTSH